MFFFLTIPSDGYTNIYSTHSLLLTFQIASKFALSQVTPIKSIRSNLSWLVTLRQSHWSGDPQSHFALGCSGFCTERPTSRETPLFWQTRAAGHNIPGQRQCISQGLLTHTADHPPDTCYFHTHHEFPFQVQYLICNLHELASA